MAREMDCSFYSVLRTPRRSGGDIWPNYVLSRLVHKIIVIAFTEDSEYVYPRV